ncbi:MAG: DUF1294 domain-containing protein [Clostridia bacterium]|nr:DUF1294 domain-containing protein [Clostridia bacterium]
MNTLILIINIFTFLLFGFDKMRAKNKGFRVPEVILILLSLFFGGVGAILGMVVFNHKTSKMSFRIIVPLAFAFNYIFSYDSFSLFKQILTSILQIIPE